MKNYVIILKVSLLLFVFFFYKNTLFSLINENIPFAELTHHKAEVNNMSFSPDGNYFAATSVDGNISLWDTKNFKFLKSITASAGNISFAKFSPDNRCLASIDGDEKLKIWSLPKLKLDREIKLGFKPTFLSFSPEKTSFILGTSTGNIIFYSLQSMKEIKTLKGNGIPVTAVYFSKTDQRCISGYEDGKVIIWSQFDTMLSSFSAHKKEISLLGYVQKDRYILTAGKDNKVKFWLSKTLKSTGTICELPENGIFSTVSSNEKLITIACSNDTIEFMSLPSGLYGDTFRPNVSNIKAFTLSDDDKFIAVGNSSGAIEIYRNPMLIKKYNFAIEKGDEAMQYGKYELAMVKYNEALGLFTEKEIEAKLKEARKLKEERQKGQYQKIKGIRNNIRE